MCQHFELATAAACNRGFTLVAIFVITFLGVAADPVASDGRHSEQNATYDILPCV